MQALLDRGIHVHDPRSAERWLKGSTYPWKQESEWPRNLDAVSIHNTEALELKRVSRAAVECGMHVPVLDKLLCDVSCWKRLSC